jgi:hypothetical protein
VKKIKAVMIGLLVLQFILISGLVSGKTVTEKREVPVFQSVELKGNGSIYLKQGNDQSLEVKTDDKFLQALKTKVNNKGELSIGFEHVTNPPPLDVFITMKEIKALIISGSGKIRGDGSIKSSDIKVTINGSGEITLNLDAENTTSEIYGSGAIILTGQAKAEILKIFGSGKIEAFDLKCEKSQIEIYGSGQCRVNVAAELSVQINGSGEVAYKGKPVVNSKMNGSGRLQSAN